MPYSFEQAKADKQKFLKMAEEAAAKGDHGLAGLYHVEAHNCVERVGMRKAHVPNLGPYTTSNPKHCMHCGNSSEQWGEECVPILGLGKMVRGIN